MTPPRTTGRSDPPQVNKEKKTPETEIAAAISGKLKEISPTASPEATRGIRIDAEGLQLLLGDLERMENEVFGHELKADTVETGVRHGPFDSEDPVGTKHFKGKFAGVTNDVPCAPIRAADLAALPPHLKVEETLRRLHVCLKVDLRRRKLGVKDKSSARSAAKLDLGREAPFYEIGSDAAWWGGVLAVARQFAYTVSKYRPEQARDALHIVERLEHIEGDMSEVGDIAADLRRFLERGTTLTFTNSDASGRSASGSSATVRSSERGASGGSSSSGGASEHKD